MDQDQERFISRVKATGGVPGVQNIQLPLCPSTRPERLGSGVGAGFGWCGAVNEVDVTPRESSFSEKLLGMNKAHLQNTAGKNLLV